MRKRFDPPATAGRASPGRPITFARIGGPRSATGLTLIELMIAVAILGIVVAIALPSYEGSVRKSRRADAHLALQRIQLEQDKLRAECNSYAAGLHTTRICDSVTPGNNRLALSSTSPDGFYSLALSGASATGYTASATAVSGQAQAADTNCLTITLTVSGATLSKSPADCWSR